MRIGILGAGQLGRMLASAGRQIGHSFVLYDTSGKSCPGPGELISDPENKLLNTFIEAVDCVTFEQENLPAALLETLSRHVEVIPNPRALMFGKDREMEKRLFTELGIPTPRFFIATTFSEFTEGLAALGCPAVAKTTTGGYDGKGQAVIKQLEDAPQSWEALNSNRILVEEFIPFEREISVIACRDLKGEIGIYAPTENKHDQGILRYSIAPAPGLSQDHIQQAETYIKKLLVHLDYTGTLTLELFLTANGLIANEIAPRVHNSGHWTMDGAHTSQFENHIRAISGQALGSTKERGVSCMVNIIGEHAAFDKLSALPYVHCYDYGKSPMPNRKLGHMNITAESYDELYPRVEECLSVIKNPPVFIHS